MDEAKLTPRKTSAIVESNDEKLSCELDESEISDNDEMNKTKTTPRKLDSSDNKEELSGFDKIDLSGESEVFDLDEDPEYRPSDEDNGVYKMSRMFELRYQRQLEPDQRAGSLHPVPWIMFRMNIQNLLPLKMYVRRKKPMQM